MKCQGGCERELRGDRDTFGGIGEAFCFACWYELQNLLDLRVPLLQEQTKLRQEAANISFDIETLRERHQKIPLDFRFDLTLVQDRLSEIREELECLTLAYQRRHGGI